MTSTGQQVQRVRAYDFVPAELLGEIWATLRRAEGAEAMAWEAARLSTAAALANAQTASKLRRFLAECGAFVPERDEVA